MRFRMKDFRRFHDSGFSEIKPITILLGENSSGKTSFLAGLRYALETLSTKGEGSFNREPFFLGAYDQIAHYRGGRFGRAATFSLSLQIAKDEIERLIEKNRRGFIRRNPQNSFIDARFDFANSQSQPLIKTIHLANEHVSIEMDRETLPQFQIRITGERRHSTVKPEEEFAIRSASSLVDRNSITPFYNAIQYFTLTNRRRRASKTAAAIDENRINAIEIASLGLLFFGGDAVYASAPFRTKPERTYSPVEASSSAEGAHIPILLAQSKAFEPKQWASIKERLEAFGVKSQMFKKIDVKRLGRHQSDPFQITVTVSKDKSNLIDVGYGVSQILPLLVETLINERALFFLYQQPEVHLHPRAQAELGSYLVDFAMDTGKYIILETHSDFIIDRVRSDISSRGIKLQDALSVLFFERDEFETKITRINFDGAGNVVDPPPGYRDFFINEAARTLGF